MRLALAFLPAALAAPLSLSLADLGGLARWGWDAPALAVQEIFADDSQTIWGQLKSEDRFSKLVKILNFEGSVYKDLDNSAKNYQITFFAPNNEALTPPKHHDDDDDDDDSLASLTALSAALEAHDLKPDDDDKKRRREILRKIARAVLQYHLLPHAHSEQSLATNSTMATALAPHDGSSDGLHRRIHISKQALPPALVINFYAKVKSSADAKNGKLHELDHPLLPPGSIFDEMFMLRRWISSTSSAIQAVGGRHFVDWGYDHEHSKPGKPRFHGTPLATFFAPSNEAWDALPEHLQFYLFSRFGRHALAKLLAYHYVPHSLVLSEVQHTAKHKDHDGHKHPGHGHHGHDHKHKHLDNDPSFHKEFKVHAGCGGDLDIVVDKTKILPVEGAVKVSMKVNGHDVETLDIPAGNGAWHVLDAVLCPPHEGHGGDVRGDPWEGWEAWLPAWAESA